MISTGVASTFIDPYRISGMLRMQNLCGHKSLNILLQVFVKYVSARDPSSAIFLVKYFERPPNKVAFLMGVLLFSNTKRIVTSRFLLYILLIVNMALFFK